MDQFFVSFYPKSRFSRTSDSEEEPRSRQYLLNTFKKASQTISSSNNQLAQSFTTGFNQAQKDQQLNTSLTYSPKKYKKVTNKKKGYEDNQGEWGFEARELETPKNQSNNFQQFILNQYQQTEKQGNSKIQDRRLSSREQNLKILSQTKELNPYAYRRIIDLKFQQSKSFIHSQKNQEEQSIQHDNHLKFFEEQYSHELQQFDNVRFQQSLDEDYNPSIQKLVSAKQNKPKDPFQIREQNAWKYKEQMRQLCFQFRKQFDEFEPLINNEQKQNIIDDVKNAINETQHYHQNIEEEEPIQIFVDQIDLPKNQYSHLRFLQNQLDHSLQFKGFEVTSQIYHKKLNNTANYQSRTNKPINKQTNNNNNNQSPSTIDTNQKFASQTHEEFYITRPFSHEFKRQTLNFSFAPQVLRQWDGIDENSQIVDGSPDSPRYEQNQLNKQTEGDRPEEKGSTEYDPNFDDQVKTSTFDAFFQRSSEMNYQDLSNYCRLSRSIKKRQQETKQGDQIQFDRNFAYGKQKSSVDKFKANLSNSFSKGNSSQFNKDFSQQLFIQKFSYKN